jgi:Recombination endonuclease VII
MEITTRADARAKGLTRYFTGKACKRGHVCERLVASKDCWECFRHRLLGRRGARTILQRKRYAANPEKSLAINRKCLYGPAVTVLPDDFRQHHCPICNQTDPNGLVVDHSHASKCVRAPICGPCNRAIGHAKEDPARLRALADYLERQAEFERLAPYLNLTINHARRRPAEHPSDQELIK